MTKSCHRRALYLISLGTLIYTVPLAAQTAHNADTKLSDTPWTMPRLRALSGALSPFADSSEAPFANPALIGALPAPSDDAPRLREFQFPLLGVAQGTQSATLASNVTDPEGGAFADLTTAAGSVAQKRTPHYGRLSLVPNIVVGRFLFGFAYDQQLAGTPDAAENVRLYQRTSSGPIAGLSFADPAEKLHVGFFASHLLVKETRGTFSSAMASATDDEEIVAAFKEATNTVQVTSLNAGLLWRIAKRAEPKLAIVVRGLGAKRTEIADETKKPREVSAALGVSPKLGKWARLNIGLEGLYREDHHRDALGLGFELTLGPEPNSKAYLALRAGYRESGPSFGALLRLGLISLQATQYAEDIGASSKRVVEQRTEAVAIINVAEY